MADGPASDPFGDDRPKPLAVNYLPGSGDMMVYGGVVVAALGVLTWLVRGDPVFLLMVPTGLIVSAYFYPLIEKGVPRFGADPRGLYFERLGIIPWEAIRDVRHQQRALRTLRLHTLHVELTGPAHEVVREQEAVGPFKALMSKSWKSKGNRISVELHPLSKDPITLVDRMLSFRPELLASVQAQRTAAVDGTA